LGESLKGLSRRDFLKVCGATATIMGLSQSYVPQIAQAIEGAAAKTPVLWLQGQNCTGCSVSALNSNHPSIAEIVLDILSFRYQPNIMAASGDQAIQVIKDTIKNEKGKYVLIWEGAVPDKEDGLFAAFGEENGKPMTADKWVTEAADNAAVVIAMGSCAAFGGIPRANQAVTGAKGLLFDGTAKGGAYKGSTPVVNVPGCPPNPDWLIGTVVYYLMNKKAPDVDNYGRPKMFYGQTIHDNCERRASFEAGLYLEKWGDKNAIAPADGGTATQNYCLVKKGCKGPVTYSDCPMRRWNSRTNWPIGSHGICIGCTQPEFYAGLAPLYEKIPEVKLFGIQTTADNIAKVLGVAVAIGLGAHLVGNFATGRLTSKGGEK
jgi:hydrogenase small subunit